MPKDTVNRKIVEFILQWRYILRASRVKKSLWRTRMAERYVKLPQVANKEWTSDDFCKAWDWVKANYDDQKKGTIVL